MREVINYLPHSGTLSIEHYLFVGNPTTAPTASLPAVSALAALRPIERAPDVLFVIGCWDGESKRYRVYNIADGLERLGLRVVVIRFEDVPNIVSNDIRPKVVVFFRAPLMPGCGIQEAIDHVKSWGGKTIFDIDDYVFEPDIIGQIDGVKALNALEKEQYTAGVHMYRALLLACDKVTVTTEFLAERVRELGREASVIPNTINSAQQAKAVELLAREQPVRDFVRVGYFSGSATHQSDFAIVEPHLQAIMRAHPEVKFRVVGLLDLGSSWNEFSNRIERIAFCPYLEMLELMSGCDINLAPLVEGDPFCESKSELKFFEAALVQVPTIASRTETFTSAITSGKDGILASTPEEWRAVLEALVTDQSERLRIGKAARESALKKFDYLNIAKRAARAYGLRQTGQKSTADKKLKIGWIVPGLILGGGGHRNILRAAFYLERLGHTVTLIFTNTNETADKLKLLVREHFYPFEGDVQIYSRALMYQDVLLATHWSTVEPALAVKDRVREVIYFVQDFEPGFAPIGSEYVLAENTYRKGLYAITSGPWCERILRQDFKMEADHFQFPIDKSMYFDRKVTRRNRVIFFAKPEMPRRCFEIGRMALREFHNLRPDVEIAYYGSNASRKLEVDYPVTHLGVLPGLTDLADLYSSAKLGIVFSTTNPSLVPYEMMACGLPVVDLGRPGNEINYANRTDIAYLASPEPEIMAREIAALIDDPKELSRRANAALTFVSSFPTEEEMGARIESLIVRRLALSKTMER